MSEPFVALREAVRSRLWPLPILAVVVALAAGITVPYVESAAEGALPTWLTSVAFSGDAGAARTVLDAISSSLITVTSLTFSLTVVTLQLASSQFSPRLLRTFTSDVFVQVTLGVFLATFTYSLTVLRTVRGSDAAVAEFVPRLAVTLSFVLTVASVVMLVVFLAHLAQQIRIETILRDVHDDARATIEATLTTGRPDAPGADVSSQAQALVLPTPPSWAFTVLAPASGFLVRVDQQRLQKTCQALGVIMILHRHVGNSIIEHTPIGTAWRQDGRSASEETSAQLQKRLAQALRTGPERTAVQDVGYGLRQLTDVANKALSPGINDPTTAVHTLGHISALLCELTGYDLSPTVLTDDDGQVRAMLHRPGLEHLVEAAIGQPRRYGASDPQVLERIFQLLAELAYRSDPSQHPVVSAQLKRLLVTMRAQDFDPTEKSRLEDAAGDVRDALTQGSQRHAGTGAHDE